MYEEIRQSSSIRTFVKKMAVINAERTDIKVGVTFFADLSEEEALQYYGGKQE